MFLKHLKNINLKQIKNFKYLKYIFKTKKQTEYLDIQLKLFRSYYCCFRRGGQL